MKKVLVLFGFSLLAMKNLHAEERPYQSGDLIFFDLACGEVCEAMEDVTLEQFGLTEPRLSHIGILERLDSGELLLWEAWPVAGVSHTPLNEALKRPSQKIFWAPLEEAYREQALKTLKFIKAHEGRAYDSEFLYSNSRYYCSELIQEAWPSLFQTRPMYFGAPDSKAYSIWADYYSKLSMEIPIGKEGVSPLGIYVQALEVGLFKEESIRILVEKD